MRAAAGPGHIHYIDYFQQPGVAEAEFEADIEASISGFVWSISGDAPPAERFRQIPAGGRFIDSFRAPRQLPARFTRDDLAVYAAAFRDSGFRGGLNWYRNVDRNWEQSADMAGAVVVQPAMFVTGSRDPARNPVAMEHLSATVPGLRVFEVLKDCGHWTQQERPDEVTRLIKSFLLGL